MSHIDHETVESGDLDIPVEWLAVGSSVGELANRLAFRSDIIAVVGPEAGRGAPACFMPHHAEVELNSVLAFGPQADPESIGDLCDPKRQYDYPRAVGLIAHEAFHARYSIWKAKDAASQLSKEEFSALEVLEESRIEFQGMQDEPRTREFIRSAVIDLNLDGELDTEKTEAAFTAFALVNARIQAGTLLESEVQDVAKQVVDFLGPDLALHLYGIVEKFQRSRSVPELYALAKEWVAAKKRAAEERGEEQFDIEQAADAIRDALEEIMLKASISLADQESDEAAAEHAAEVGRQANDRKRNEQKAQEIFGHASALGSSLTSSYLLERRAPSAAERAAAVVVAKELEKAKYHDRIELETDNYLPPGRLRTRSLVQTRAAESKGLRVASTPWRRTKRKHAIDPNLTVGVMVDISGSMNRAMEPMAVTAWVMSEAVRRVQGKAAMVYYGDSVFPALKPGEHLDQVYTYGAFDGTEAFDDAFRSLDGSLGLIGGTGARLLVVSSDGHYRPDQLDKARYWIQECGNAGVAVLWLPYNGGNGVDYLLSSIPRQHVSVVPGTISPADVATRIGQAAATALAQASQ